MTAVAYRTGLWLKRNQFTTTSTWLCYNRENRVYYYVDQQRVYVMRAAHTRGVKVADYISALFRSSCSWLIAIYLHSPVRRKEKRFFDFDTERFNQVEHGFKILCVPSSSFVRIEFFDRIHYPSTSSIGLLFSFHVGRRTRRLTTVYRSRYILKAL